MVSSSFKFKTAAGSCLLYTGGILAANRSSHAIIETFLLVDEEHRVIRRRVDAVRPRVLALSP